MSSTKYLRVGDVVYDKGVVAFTRIRGGWYKQRKNNGEVLEFDPVDVAVARQLDELADASTLQMTGAEQDTLRLADVCTDRLQRGEVNRQRLLQAVRSRVSKGLRKYGPYDAQKDERRLDQEIRRCIENAVVFTCMQLLKQDSEVGRRLVGDLARAWVEVGCAWPVERTRT